MAAMAASLAAGVAASATPAAAASVSLRPARAPTPAAAFPRLRHGTRPRSLPLRIRASAEASGSQTFTDVRKIIAEQLAVEPKGITAESKFTDLGADSLDTVEIMMALEEKFDIQLDADKGESIKTVQDAVGLIEQTVAASK